MSLKGHTMNNTKVVEQVRAEAKPKNLRADLVRNKRWYKDLEEVSRERISKP